MSEQTKIEWADHTFNPWMGCTKVSPGCANCYAEATMDTWLGKVCWGKGQTRERTSPANWKLPLKWNAAGKVCVQCATPVGSDGDCACGQIGACGETRRPRVFCASLADWLDDEVPIEWLADLLQLIRETPELDWLLLTKRPVNWRERVRQCILTCRQSCEGRCYWLQEWLNGNPPANVWMGTSVEDQQRADERIPELLKIPARVRFLSVEPLLGPISLSLLTTEVPYRDGYEPTKVRSIDWVIVGGESGPKAGACDVVWIRDVVTQCKTAGVPCFVKQLGSNPTMQESGTFVSEDSERVGDAIANQPVVGLSLKSKKGGDPAEWPEDLRVRQFPAT